jgi:hypothetical protein
VIKKTSNARKRKNFTLVQMSNWSTSCPEVGGEPGLFEDPKSFYVVEGFNLN